MHTLCLLCRLLLDTSIVRNCEALIAIQDAFENLMTATPDIYGEHEVIIFQANFVILAETFPRSNRSWPSFIPSLRTRHYVFNCSTTFPQARLD
jgi:hypothetical protein